MHRVIRVTNFGPEKPVVLLLHCFCGMTGYESTFFVVLIALRIQKYLDVF